MKHTPRDTPNAPDDAALIDTPAAGTRATADDADDAGGTQAHGLAEAPRRAQRQYAAQRLWRVEAIYIVALLLFATLAVCARVNPYFAWDLSGERELQELHNPAFFALMRFVSVFGNGPVPVALTIAAILFFLWRNRRTEAAGLALSAVGGSLLNVALKTLIARPRPTPALVQVFHPLDTRSFPSGHVVYYVCFFGFLFFAAYAVLPKGSTARRVALPLMALPVLLVGLSRVYLGAHWPSDTIGAYLIGGLWLALSLHFYRGWKARSTFHKDRKTEANLTAQTRA